MKKSNSILLATALLFVSITVASQLALHLKYKNGQISTPQTRGVESHIIKALPTPKALIVSGVETVTLLPSAAFSIQYYKPHPVEASDEDGSSFGSNVSDSSGALLQPTITNINDTIRISCPVAGKKIASLQILGLSDGKTPITIRDGMTTLFGSEAEGGPDYQLNLDSTTFFVGQVEDQRGDHNQSYIHSLDIKGAGIGFNMTETAHIQSLRLQLTSNSLLSVLNANQIDSLRISLDDESNVQLSGAMLKKTKFE